MIQWNWELIVILVLAVIFWIIGSIVAISIFF
jgi:hypothetical protein